MQNLVFNKRLKIIPELLWITPNQSVPLKLLKSFSPFSTPEPAKFQVLLQSASVFFPEKTADKSIPAILPPDFPKAV